MAYRRLKILIYTNTGTDLEDRDFDERMANACTLYRAILPARYSRHDVRITNQISSSVEKDYVNKVVKSVAIETTDIKWADIVIFQRHFEQVALAGGAAEIAMRMGKIVMYETDDYIHKAGQLTKLPLAEMPLLSHNIRFVNWILPLVDAMSVTTKELADAYRGTLDSKAMMCVLPNSLDPDDWDFAPKEHTNDGVIKIGWQGSWSHMHDFEDTGLLDALRQIQKEYGKKVRVEFLTNLKKEQINFKGARFLKPVPLKRYPKKLHDLAWDIGLAPLRDTEFNRAKSNIKYMEYGMLGIPTIASQVAPYIGIKGVVVKNRYLDWYKAIKRLIDDPELRTKLGEEAMSDVLCNYNIQINAKLWDHTYEDLVSSKQ